jgi:hypothetical protein
VFGPFRLEKAASERPRKHRWAGKGQTSLFESSPSRSADVEATGGVNWDVLWHERVERPWEQIFLGLGFELK